MLEHLLDDPRVLVLGGILVVGGLFVFFEGFKKLRTLRRIENTPTCRVRSMPMGSVEVKGAARMAEPLEAPFTGKRVAYFEIEIEEYRRHGKNSRWVSIHGDASQDPFYLEDDTGQVLIIPQGAELHLPNDFVRKSSRFSSVPQHLQSYMSSNGLERTFFSRGRSLRFTERHIEVGQPVYVHGVAGERPALDLWREQMERVSERLRDVKADPDAMQRLDTDADGRVSEDEWQFAHSDAVAEVRGEGVEDRVAIARGNAGELFVISDRSEKNLVRRLQLESAGGVFGGGGAFIAGVVILTSVLKQIRFFG